MGSDKCVMYKWALARLRERGACELSQLKQMEGVHHHGCREEKVVLIREMDGDKDLEVVEKLERSCEVGSRRGYSILTNMLGDPLCRVRLFPVHIMLVAELVRDGSVVGMVRGCMKCVATGLGTGNVRMGCILGLRVSPKHRRMGIGSELIKSVEGWAIRNGAQYISVATEETNVASKNLFTLKFHYTKLSSLAILVEPIDLRAKKQLPHNVNIEKLSINQAISLYKNRLGNHKFFPVDIDAILDQQLSLGTWVSYFKGESWNSTETPSSWAVLTMWKTYESYKLQVRGAPLVRCFHATLGHIGSKVLPCFKVGHLSELLSRPFGFLFLFGLHGEGERMGELMRALWCFASRLGEEMRDCKAVVAELGVGDPMREHVMWGSSVSHIDDVWFLKRVGAAGATSDRNEDWTTATSQPVFVDPRDF